LYDVRIDSLFSLSTPFPFQFNDVEPEPQPFVAGLWKQRNQATGSSASVLAESEIRAGLRVGPGTAASAIRATSLTLRPNLTSHEEEDKQGLCSFVDLNRQFSLVWLRLYT
jgi:hypothetical protein